MSDYWNSQFSLCIKPAFYSILDAHDTLISEARVLRMSRGTCIRLCIISFSYNDKSMNTMKFNDLIFYTKRNSNRLSWDLNAGSEISPCTELCHLPNSKCLPSRFLPIIIFCN